MRKDGQILVVTMFGVTAAALLPAGAIGQTAPAETQPSVRPATEPPKRQVPITFVRCGRKVAAEMAAVNFPHKEFVLRAFGRAWTVPAPLKIERGAGWTAEFEVPSVRVPTVFAITPIKPVSAPQSVLGELVAYPAGDVAWDKKIGLYSCGAPAWFEQWAAATGLPVERIAAADLAAGKLAADTGTKALLILGASAAGKDAADALKLAKHKGANLLVLDAEWFGDSAAPVSVCAAQMRGGLAEIARQRWPQPLKFGTRRRPWSGIANRWAWITGDDGLPLAEQIGAGPGSEEPGRPTILSYVPWQQQLGRSESADATLTALLKAAGQAKPQTLLAAVEMIYPAAGDVDGRARPVLEAAVRAGKNRAVETVVSILDFRGKAVVQRGVVMRTRDGTVLILGDDKLLDEWEWLKLDRAKKHIGRADVQWLPDDELPPSKDNQIRLMLKLTELGVPLASPGQEEQRK